MFGGKKKLAQRQGTVGKENQKQQEKKSHFHKINFLTATFISQEIEAEKAKLARIYKLDSNIIVHNLENRKIHE